jgi:eukaryotic-like serine/threonine-protein kinase
MPETKPRQLHPAIIGEYEIIRKIGEGGLAEIYLARQRSLNRKVAIKMLHIRLSEESELIRRFEREATTLAEMSHPNIVQIFDRGEENGRLYFVMQFVEGTDFAQILAGGEWDVERKLNVVVQVLKGLEYAHKNGIVHRDIKPANILIDSEDNALVADFGISHILRGDHTQLTEPGAMVGTFAYMSPEQKEDSSRLDLTTDIYSVGVMLYEALTGKKPTGRYRPPSSIDHSLPQSLDAVVAKALEHEPSRRYQRAVEMKDELLAVMHRGDRASATTQNSVERAKTLAGSYAFLDTLKNGVYSSTYLVEDRASGSLFVIKKQSKPDIGMREAKLLANLRHPNILPIQGAGCDSAKLVIIMEYAQGGSLADRLVKPMHHPDARKLMLQIASGMDFAHKSNVIHGNLKPANILFDKADVAKMADFALMASVDKNSANWYAAPERRRSKAGDIYAAGIIFFQLLTNRKPMFDTHGNFVWIDGVRTTPPQLREIIEMMVKTMPSERIQSFAEVHDLIARSEAVTPATSTRSGDPSGPHDWLRLAAWGSLFMFLLILLVLYLTGALKP